MLDLLLQVLEMVVMTVTPILVGYLISFVSTKIKANKTEATNQKIDKYMSMLENTITSCVLATTQTYVETLKKKGQFGIEAQSVAFQLTKEAVLKILTDEAKAYLTEAYGDLDEYLNQRIEAEVQLQK